MEIELEVPPPPAVALPPTRPPTACERHPGEPVVGFCASCLRERLADLEATADVDEGPRRSTSSAIKSLFSRSSNAGGSGANLQSSSFRRPELRRCKSFSASRRSYAAAAFEAQRKSCDVRVRNTLWSLFHQDDRDRAASQRSVLPISSSAAAEIVEECPNVGSPFRERNEEDEVMVEAEVKPMKTFIDLTSQEKKPPVKEMSGSFWLAASVFSQKLLNWRRNHKLKKKHHSALPPEKTTASSRPFRDTQSEVAIDTLGRRSCDMEPRFSLDAGRFSFDDPRYSWDEPRASWDGYLIGGRTVHFRLPPMLAVAEDSPTPSVQRFDGLIPVEDDLAMPGGSSQTRDYYDDSSSRGRRSLERCSSTKKHSFEMKEPAAKISPTISSELIQSYHGNKHERDSKEWSSNSLRDECSESFDSGYRDRSKVPPAKKSRRWSKAWSFLGLIHWRVGGGSRNRANGMERSFSETWPDLGLAGHKGKFSRSNSNASMRRNGFDTGGHRMKKKREELKLDRNPSSRYSPGHFDNALMRFYLQDMKGSRRRTGGWGRKKHGSHHSFNASMLNLY
ncbi:hypothetical protein HPP92_017436 [Vanilla planifolia]|uniref:Uncharacterized protein n=1 Tax=Vanilla planifolia TaxID=51239 RepID=A0A835QG25_VANPL|nr:hypothetical protein HPP92_017436 [Vanilla planifolia]